MEAKTPIDLVVDQLAFHHLIDAHEVTKKAHVKQILLDNGYVASGPAAPPDEPVVVPAEPPSVNDALARYGPALPPPPSDAEPILHNQDGDIVEPV